MADNSKKRAGVEPPMGYLEGVRWCPLAGRIYEWDEGFESGCLYCPDSDTGYHHRVLVEHKPCSDFGGREGDPR